MEGSTTNKLIPPNDEGWYWVLENGTDSPIPCWFMKLSISDADDWCFLPGGLGDSSSTGIFIDDIEKIGPAISQPEF